MCSTLSAQHTNLSAGGTRNTFFRPATPCTSQAAWLMTGEVTRAQNTLANALTVTLATSVTAPLMSVMDASYLIQTLVKAAPREW
jgi:CO/xanthine dehydrogenase FAD-binding subunit